MFVEKQDTVSDGPAVRTKRLRLGLYDPDPENPVIIYIGRRFRDNPDNRLRLRRSIEKFNGMAQREGIIEMCLGVFTVQS